MPSLSTFFIVFICAGIGLKTAVITESFHPAIGIIIGAIVGFASIRFQKGPKS